MTVEVVVLGGGYAGVAAANKIASGAKSAHVTLVNRAPRFFERIRLHQFSAGSREDVSHDFGSVLHGDVSVVVADATGIDLEKQVVELGEQGSLRYDYFVYTAGSGAATAPEGCFSVAEPESATKLRARLRELPSGATVKVIGGGLTGVETASEIAQQHPLLKVTLRTDGMVTPSLGEGGRKRVRRGLQELGVTLIENSPASELTGDVVVWCAGFKVPSLARDSGLAVDERGRLLLDANLRAPGFERVFGAGDAVAISEPGFEFIRMSCAAALPMGQHVGANVARVIRGEQPRAFSTMYGGQCLSLGRGNAVVQFVHANDAPRPLSISGRVGGWMKEGICQMTVKALSMGAGSASGRRAPAGSALREGEAVTL